MIDAKQFATSMLLSVDAASLDFAELRERESLWPLWGVIEEQTLAVGQTTLQLSVDTIDVVLVAFNRSILTRATEAALNATNRDWQSAANEVPRNWLYRGEQPLQVLRIYPPSASEGRIQVIKNILPPSGVARWHEILVAISIISRLSISDPLRARIPDVEFCNELVKLITEPFGGF